MYAINGHIIVYILVKFHIFINMHVKSDIALLENIRQSEDNF
jgi:hypothetical protein